MLEKPDLQDEKIVRLLQERYGVAVTELEFLPIGADGNAGVYRVKGGDEQTYFLKVKRGGIGEPGVVVPGYLRDRGIQEVVAPIPDYMGRLWARIEDFTLLLYPFLDGDNGWTIPLSDEQWARLGAALRQIHTTPLPAEITALVERETFSPDGRAFVRGLLREVGGQAYDDPHQREMAALWDERRTEIKRLVEMAERLAAVLRLRPLEYVLCHSDLHMGNVLLSEGGGVFIVDWDQPILAPKERDLMFIGGGIGPIRANEVACFYKGYGQVDIDGVALAYYRYERIVQDFMEFGRDVFNRPGLTGESRQAAVDLVRGQFAPDAVIDIAHRTEAYLPLELRWED